MAKGAPVFLLMALLICEPAQAQDTTSAYAGIFANTEITMTLRKQGAGYTGQVQFDGQRFAVAAQEAGTVLQGTYSYNGQAIPFQAMVQGETMTIASEGLMYTRPARMPPELFQPMQQRLRRRRLHRRVYHRPVPRLFQLRRPKRDGLQHARPERERRVPL